LRVKVTSSQFLKMLPIYAATGITHVGNAASRTVAKSFYCPIKT
jgi:hypothetical protein